MYLLYCVFLSFLFLPTCSLSAWSGGGIRNYLPLLAHGGKNNHLIAFFSCASAKAGASLFVVLILGTASNPKITDDRKSHQVHSGFTFVFQLNKVAIPLRSVTLPGLPLSVFCIGVFEKPKHNTENPKHLSGKGCFICSSETLFLAFL